MIRIEGHYGDKTSIILFEGEMTEFMDLFGTEYLFNSLINTNYPQDITDQLKPHTWSLYSQSPRFYFLDPVKNFLTIKHLNSLKAILETNIEAITLVYDNKKPDADYRKPEIFWGYGNEMRSVTHCYPTMLEQFLKAPVPIGTHGAMFAIKYPKTEEETAVYIVKYNTGIFNILSKGVFYDDFTIL